MHSSSKNESHPNGDVDRHFAAEPAGGHFQADPGPAVFHWLVTTDQVWWSPAMYSLCGYAGDDVAPSMALLVEHQHPQDRERAEVAFQRIRRDGKPFVFEHRLVTKASATRTVILSARASPGPNGRPDLVVGTNLDVSDARRIHHMASADTVGGLQAELSRLTMEAESRDLINMATGVLVERHKIPVPEAGALLRQGSQLAGRKLFDVASELLFSGKLPSGVAIQPRRPKPGPVVRRTAR